MPAFWETSPPARLPCQPARVCPRLPAIGAGHDIGGRLASDPHAIRKNRVPLLV
jgi:hypothetical protein